MFLPSGTECEVITPFKIALLVLVKNYGDVTDGRHPNHSRIVWLDHELTCKRRLNLSLISWIQQPDGTLKSILQVLGSCSRTLHSSLCESLQNFCDSDSPNMLDEFFEDLSAMISDPLEDNLLQRGGILGIFCRRMVLYHEKLAFCHLRPLHEKLIKYCSLLLVTKKPFSFKKSFRRDSGDMAAEDDKSDFFDEMELESQSELDSKSSEESALGADLKPSDLKTEDKSEDLEVTEVFTSRQADYFFSTQAALITDKETRAMSPAKLQNKISQILKNNPRLTEAHYLSYLNCLRVREFCGSIDCLLTYFNRHAKSSSTKTSGGPSTLDQATSVYRYAALNLALLHYRFGHRNAAIAAAREAVDLSQLASDMQCLQHAMSLMTELDSSNVNLSLLEHQVKPAKQMNLVRLAAKAIQRDVNKQALLGKRPRLVFVQLTASEGLARSRAVESLCSTSFIHKGALWRMYGKRRMAALYCQLALTSNWASRKGLDSFPWQPNTSDVALSLCHLLELLHETGCISASQEIFEHVKQRFPKQTEHCKIWLLSELRLKHKMAIRSCRFSEAIQIEQNILPLDKQEAEFRKAERLYLNGDDVKSHSVLQSLLKYTTNCDMYYEIGGIKQCTPELKCQIYLLLGKVLFNETCDSAASLSYLLKALSTATKFYLHGLVVDANLLIVQIQFFSNMVRHAQNTLKSLAHECLTNDTLLNASRLKMIIAKLKMDAKSKGLENCNRIIDMVLSAKRGFEAVQDLHRQKDALYFLARLYHEKFVVLSNDNNSTKSSISEAIANRNKYSSEFKQIDLCTFSSSRILI